MASGFVPYAESFYESTLASAIGASDSTISLVTPPTKTEGYLVIEYNSSNREIIKYTGVSGSNITGCVRGLSETANSDAAGTGKTHPAGVSVACKDVHYYFNNVIALFRGDSASGFNTYKMGDGGAVSTANRFQYFITSSVSSFFGLSSSGKMVVSEDGITSYVVSSGGSGVTAGAGIDITAGVVTTANLSTGGIGTSASKNAIATSTGIGRNANGIYVDQSSAMYWTALHNFTDISVDNIQLSAAVSSINQVVDGVSTSVTAANLGTLTKGSSDGTNLHYHALALNADQFAVSSSDHLELCTHSLGYIPRYIEVDAWQTSGAGVGSNTTRSLGISSTGAYVCIQNGSVGASNKLTDRVVNLVPATGTSQQAQVVSATSASFYLSWSKGGSPTGNAVTFFWKAYGK